MHGRRRDGWLPVAWVIATIIRAGDEFYRRLYLVSLSNVNPVGWYGWLGMPLLWLRRGQSYKEQLPQLKRAIET